MNPHLYQLLLDAGLAPARDDMLAGAGSEFLDHPRDRWPASPRQADAHTLALRGARATVH